MVVEVVVVSLDPQDMEDVATPESGKRQIPVMAKHEVVILDLKVLGDIGFDLPTRDLLGSQTVPTVLH